MPLELPSLKSIISHIRIHISTVCTFPVFDSESIRLDIEEYGAIVSKYIKDGNLTANELEDVQMINKMTKALYYMVEERLHLQCIATDRLTNKENRESCTKSEKFEVNTSEVTECDTQVQTSQKKTHRLEKSQIDELEKWFHTNNSFPYLTPTSTEYLTSKTNLSVKQVRNWYVLMRYSHGPY